jgi:hypothetical protein
LNHLTSASVYPANWCYGYENIDALLKKRRVGAQAREHLGCALAMPHVTKFFNTCLSKNKVNQRWLVIVAKLLEAKIPIFWHLWIQKSMEL